MSEQIDRAHDRASSCLTDFLGVLRPEARDQYKLTLIARNAAYPDGSRDIVCTSDEPAGMRTALDLSFPTAPLTALSAQRLAEIEANARAAPAGPWQLTRCDDGRWMVHTVGDTICLSDPNHGEPGDEKRMAYIAGLDPQTALALVAEIRSLARRLGEAEHKVAGLQAGRAVLVQERDEAREYVNHGLTSAATEADRWKMAHSLSQRNLAEMNGVLARVVEIAGRNEASPDIDHARRLLKGVNGGAHG